jgi:hypothetical protein
MSRRSAIRSLSSSTSFPTLTEGSTRLPVGAPLVPGPDAPPLQAAIGVAFILFLIGAALQVRRLRAEGRLAQPA